MTARDFWEPAIYVVLLLNASVAISLAIIEWRTLWEACVHVSRSLFPPEPQTPQPPITASNLVNIDDYRIMTIRAVSEIVRDQRDMRRREVIVHAAFQQYNDLDLQRQPKVH